MERRRPYFRLVLPSKHSSTPTVDFHVVKDAASISIFAADSSVAAVDLCH